MKNTQQKWEEILAAVRGTEDEEVTCDEITDEMFTVYAELLLAAEEPSARFSLFEQHMRQCPDCAQELNEIVESLRSSAQIDAAAMTSAQQTFDLTFLSPQPERALPERIRTLFMQGRIWERDQEQTLWLHLAAGMGAATTPDMIGATKVSRGQAEGIVYQLSLGSEDLGDLDLEITGVQEDDSDTCTITVQAIVPSRWPQMEGVEVTLLNGPDIRSDRTDEHGYVSFARIPMDDLSQVNVRIAP